MATAGQIATLALRDLGVVMNDAEPQAADLAAAFGRLQWLLPHLTQEFGGALYAVNAGVGLILFGGERVNVLGSTPVTITLPSRPQDGSRLEIVAVIGNDAITISGNGYRVAGATSQALNLAAGASRAYTFLAHRGEWALLEPASLSANVPLPAELDLGLAAKLATVLASQYDLTPPAEVAERAALFDARLVERFGPRLRRSVGARFAGDKKGG